MNVLNSKTRIYFLASTLNFGPALVAYWRVRCRTAILCHVHDVEERQAYVCVLVYSYNRFWNEISGYFLKICNEFVRIILAAYHDDLNR